MGVNIGLIDQLGTVIQLGTVVGSLFGALVGAFAGAYLQRRFEYKSKIKREIYRPLYNEVSKSAKGSFPKDENDKYSSKWRDFSEYKKYEVPDNLAKKFDCYSDKMFQFWKSDVRIGPTTDQVKEISNLLDQRFPDDILAKKEEEITGVVSKAGGGSLAIKNMLNMFGNIWFSADGPDELRLELINFAEANYEGHADRFRAWDEQFPDWNEELWQIIQNLDPDSYSDFKRRAKLFNEIRTCAVNLRDNLKSKVSGVL